MEQQAQLQSQIRLCISKLDHLILVLRMVFFCFERTDNIQITIITLSYNRVLILSNGSLRPMSPSKTQLISSDNTWSTIYNDKRMIDMVIHQLSGVLLV